MFSNGHLFNGKNWILETADCLPSIQKKQSQNISWPVASPLKMMKTDKDSLTIEPIEIVRGLNYLHQCNTRNCRLLKDKLVKHLLGKKSWAVKIVNKRKKTILRVCYGKMNHCQRTKNKNKSCFKQLFT